MATIKRRADRGGRWEVRYRDPSNRQRAQLFDRKVDADDFVAGVEHSKRTGTYVDPALGRITFASFVEKDYRPTMVSLEPSSRARDESYMRTHLLPTFGALPLVAIDYVACQAWVNELATRRAPATVVKAAQIMGKVMKTAVRAHRVVSNPMAEVSLPTVEESEDVYLTPAQVEALADAMGEVGARYRALVWLGCYGGPRIGELLALRWTDLDFLRRTVTISRKVIEVSGAGMVEGATKTKAGRRTVTLPRRVVAELEAHRAAFPSSTLVFTAGEGGQVRANNLRRRQWAAAVTRAGLSGFTFHDMRHTAVSLWVAAGASDLEVAKWAGHRSAAFTKSRYAHLFPEHGEALADRLEAFIAASTPTPAASVTAIHGG
ncbi:MAG TPA: tyrosine-type recombinase/integrase [Acidimicrobiales bacterium]